MDVKVPDIGDFTEVPVVSILVSVGDTVAEEDALIELESDKATMEVPSPAAGVVKEIKVAEGDKVSEGSLLVTVEAGSATAESVSEPAPEINSEDTPVYDTTAPNRHASAMVEVTVPDIGTDDEVDIIRFHQRSNKF